MKHNGKQILSRKYLLLIIDAVLTIINIIFFTQFEYSFSPLNFGRFLVTIFVVGISILAHCFANAYFPADEKDIVEEMNDILQTEDLQFETYMSKLKTIRKSTPEFSKIIDTFMHQMNSFTTKEEALMSLIELNDGKSQEFLMARNNDVQVFLIKNLKKFVKRLIAYNAKTKKNRSENIEEETGVQEILAQNNELIDLYDKLLDEVARMGDDFDIHDPGLQSVIENLQILRNGEEDEVEQPIEDFGVKLTLNGSSY